VPIHYPCIVYEGFVMNRISNRNRGMNRRASPRSASVFHSLFRTCWTDSEITSKFNKPLRPHLALCENQAGMAQPGKALDCYLVPQLEQADIQCSKELGGSNPPPRASSLLPLTCRERCR
jgi:hypothetical protein